jgi:tyrosine decarboxylase
LKWCYFISFHLTNNDNDDKEVNNDTMDSKEFRKRGTEMVEYICQYLETLEDRRVTPSVEPGYLRNLIPDEAPQKPEPWEQIMDDVESKIMPGVTHWQHPRFHAYFPAGNSFPSILGDMLGDAIGCIGFSWVFFFISTTNELFDTFLSLLP